MSSAAADISAALAMVKRAGRTTGWGGGMPASILGKSSMPWQNRRTMAAVAESSRGAEVDPSGLDRLLYPLHRLVWRSAPRRARKLFLLAETEADRGRGPARAAEPAPGRPPPGL